jgi:hypothetical protein
LLIGGDYHGVHVRAPSAPAPGLLAVRVHETAALLYRKEEQLRREGRPYTTPHVAYRHSHQRRYAPDLVPDALVFAAEDTQA